LCPGPTRSEGPDWNPGMAPLKEGGSSWRTVKSFAKLGARLSWPELALAYTAPPAAYLLLCAADGMSRYIDWLARNAMGQLLLFMPLAVIPSLMTGHMFYVDLAWPAGLLCLGFNGLVYADGLWLRRVLMGGCVGLHGGRMLLGALVIFFPYVKREDLPRYRYAKLRWLRDDGMTERTWPLKMLHDVLQQAGANASALACPVMLACFDASAQISLVEWIGYGIWLAAWCWESIADGQKLYFQKLAKKDKHAATACLGHPPFAGRAYCLWTLCRHPNYWGEWAAWNGLVLAALPSLLRLPSCGAFGKSALGAVLVVLSRFMYDCLMHWTGAEPAEHFSAAKRAEYARYQKSTRVFWPIELPGVDHGRRAGWPRTEK
jgi:steroid 5-alpha reductase family enzyme